jgi:glycosyltransferase involved in cell wall biosynthesis
LTRFGRSIIGGAETLARGLTKEATRHGWVVEVWTTCATDYTTWANTLPPGTTVEDGVTVRRFPVDAWNADTFHAINKRLESLGGLDKAGEYEWVFRGPHSTALNQFVARYAAEFDAVVAMPYLHSIPFDAAWLAGDNVLLIPCLHNEPKAYLEPFRLLLESASGVVFISPEEANFAVKDLGLRIDHSAIIGSGVQYNPPAKAEFSEELPYLLYVGRLEQGKNIPLLYDYIRRYAEEGGKVRLVIAGDGPCRPPAGPEFEFLGPVTDVEKDRLYAGSLALCQPSWNESFSLVIMESWLAGRPVLVWSGCDVTRGHVQRSKGGLWFGNYLEFKETVAWLLKHETAAGRMGANGQQYVKKNFMWQQVFSKFERTLAGWGFGDLRGL